ncbi:hypothetical protein Tco_0819483 [Tanacetum coccineum]|uniref:Uncharacterized protein n=1 Tax=Tanacetum coccineum TaxID=301880 RepID=A0ABQ5ABC0_9ASTR
MTSFRLLHSFLQVFSYNKLKINGGFERAFETLFEEDVRTFTGSMLLNLDQLEKQLGKEEFQETESMDAFRALKTQFQLLINFQDYFDYFDDGPMIRKSILAYTRIEVRQFRDTLIQHMESVKKSIDERAQLKQEYERMKAVGQNQKSMIQAADPGMMAEVQLTAQYNVLINEQQYYVQSEAIYDTYLFEKADSNTTPDSTNISHRGGEIDQDAEQYQVKGPLLNAELFKTKEMIERETYNELSHMFLLLEKYCISLELKIQQKDTSFQSNKPGKNQDAPEFRKFFEINDLKAQLQAKTTLICNLKNQIKSVKEASNEAKVKNDIDVIETINIELEHSVAKLLAANEQLHKENEHLKQNYKELYDSIKKTRVQNKDNSDSLISQINLKSVENADLKAQIQEKVFENVALKNELRKLKGNRVDTKFASQVDVKPNLPKPVTPHYLPNFRESAPSKPHHVNAPSSYRNCQKESYGSNDIAHNHFLEEAKTQDRNWNLKPREMHSARTHHTPNAFTPKPRSNNQTFRNWPASKSSNVKLNVVQKADHTRNPSSCSDSKHLVCSTCQKCVFNVNHDDCTTKFLNEVNSRAKVQSHKARNNNKPVEPKSHTQKPGGYLLERCSPITKVDNEPPDGSNDDITNLYECDQTLNVSAGTLNLSEGPAPQRKERCTLQCALSLKEEKYSYLRAVLSTTSINSHARSVNKWMNYFKPPPNVDHPVPEDPTPVPAASTSSPSLTTVDQDAASTSTSQTTSEQQSSVIPQGVEDDFYDIEVAHMDNNPYFGILIPKPSSEETTLQGVIPSNLHHLNQSFDTR